MHCPTCQNVALVMSERQGVEIDYCPNCRGVWLDRGELDKIIDRSTAQAPQPALSGDILQSQKRPEYSQPSAHAQHQNYPYKKKREGFLSELFDFD